MFADLHPVFMSTVGGVLGCSATLVLFHLLSCFVKSMRRLRPGDDTRVCGHRCKSCNRLCLEIVKRD